MRILLVRHGESHANLNQTLHKIIPDHEIALSSRGFEQAKHAGEIIKVYFEKEYADLFDANKSNKDKIKYSFDKMAKDLNVDSKVNKIFDGLFGSFADQLNSIITPDNLKPRIRLWSAPYRRTRETTNILKETLNNILFDVREDVLLSEQQFGVFDGLTDEEQIAQFPGEKACFDHVKKYNGKFWARNPLGESPFDTSCRLRQFFEVLKRDELDGINDVVIVCHGTIIRLFVMAWMGFNYEWFGSEKTPGNCSVRLLETDKDNGYLFGGYKDGKAWEVKNK